MNIVNDTPELRAELDAHNANAVRLHIPTAPVTWIDLKVEAPDGTVAHEHREKANSWNRNHYNLLASMFLPSLAPGSTFEAGSLRARQITGTISGSTTHFHATMPAIAEANGTNGSTAKGIVVGTGDGAESFEDYALGTLIATGNGAGQLAYSAGENGTAAYTAGTKTWTQTSFRVLNNNSGDAITVKEIGWYKNVLVNNSQVVLMCDRSLLASPVEVPNAYKLTVTYTTELTFPA